MLAEFVVSAVSTHQFPADNLAEVAFVGRSNVGKSSLLNALIRHLQRGGGSAASDGWQLARTSRTPGRTQTVNFYRVAESFYFVDLPGYGFARAPKQVMARWRELAEAYLRDRRSLRLVVLIVDLRHGVTSLDELMKDWLGAYRRPFVVVASKADKVRPSERANSLRALERGFPRALPFSANTGEGVPQLWAEIRRSLES
jgi:GTP-binding protein